jgi:hypothetical protein
MPLTGMPIDARKLFVYNQSNCLQNPAYDNTQQIAQSERQIDLKILSFSVDVAGKLTDVGNPGDQYQNETDNNEHTPQQNQYFGQTSHNARLLRVARRRL